jgi:lipoyl(octanoyl) transferase
MAPGSKTAIPALLRPDGRVTEWAVSQEPVDYTEAVAAMERRAARIAQGSAAELIWLLEHPALYSAGVSARPEDLLWPNRFPVVKSGRGGQFTYHGPGQQIVYVILDLSLRGRDARVFVAAMEQWIIDTLAALGVSGCVWPGRIGVWVDPSGSEAGGEKKIAAIGVKLRRWISFHGFSLNVSPDLSHFDGIVPCGIADRGVTSLAALGVPTSPQTVNQALRESFIKLFGPVARAPPPTIDRTLPAS